MPRLNAWNAVPVLLAPAAAAAHPAQAGAAAPLDALAWGGAPWLAAALAAAALAYAAGLGRLAPAARRRVFGAERRAAFGAGIATLAVALLSPLDALAGRLFAAHMVQHLLLMLVAAPLLVWGRPALAWLWALPAPARQRLARGWTAAPALRAVARTLRRPAVVWLAASAALWIWHLPGPYAWAIGHEGAHILEHACLIGTSLAFWDVVLAPHGRRRLGHGATLLFVVGMGLQNGLLGALLTFAAHPLYAPYAGGGAAFGWSALQDQQLAGLIMWVPGGLVHLGTLAALFAGWMRAAEARAVRAALAPAASPAPPRWSAPPGVAVALAGAVLLGAALAPRPAAAAGPTWQVPGGDPGRGAKLITAYGCAACHTVPGVRGANGNVGPPLTRFGDRTYVAGVLRNTSDNLMRWLRHPQQVVPGNAMPEMGVDARDARDLAAFLYTLR